MKIRPKPPSKPNPNGRAPGWTLGDRKRGGAPAGPLWGLALDFPKEGEVVSSREYAFRIGAVEAVAGIELCIDGGPWRGCRKASGYWWYDWSGYGSGEYRVVARVRPLNGEDSGTEIRRFRVELPK